MVGSTKTPSGGRLIAFGRTFDRTTKKSSGNRGRLSLFSSNHSESDTSSSSGVDEDEIHAPNEFIVECKDGQGVFVTASQGILIKARCRYFHSELLANGSDQVVRKPNWDIGTIRHIIELLSSGSTCIPNDETSFLPLQSVADELGIDIRLTSLINQHDILTKVSTDRFFPMINDEYLQFNICATVTSAQWTRLLKKGILLLMQQSVLRVKFVPTDDDAISNNESQSGPSTQRLQACDSLCSLSKVYAKGNFKALVTILDIISPVSPKQRAIQRTKREIYKIVFKTLCGSESPEDLEQLMRISTSSYKKSNCVEVQYLKAVPATMSSLVDKDEENPQFSDSKALVVAFEQKQKILTTPTSKEVTTIPEIATNANNVPEIVSTDVETQNSSMNQKQHQTGFEHRTLSGQSFLVLKHMFDVLNPYCDGDNQSDANDDGLDGIDDDEGLPACLMVANPTPDTLGRFINAAISEKCSIGFDLQDNCFFISSTTYIIATVLTNLADYNATAVVQGFFDLYERPKVED